MNKHSFVTGRKGLKGDGHRDCPLRIKDLLLKSDNHTFLSRRRSASSRLRVKQSDGRASSPFPTGGSGIGQQRIPLRRQLLIALAHALPAIRAIARASRADAASLISPAAPATSSLSASTPEQCSATSQPAASAACARSASAARQRLHRQIVAHQQAVEADLAADDVADDRRRDAWPAAPRPRPGRGRARSSPSARRARARNGARSTCQLLRARRRPPAVPRGCRRGRGRGRGYA